MNQSKKQNSLSLFGLGFRPFFLLGPLVGVIVLTIWLLSYSGSYIRTDVNILWHAHEMIYGFVMAIVIGFLLTASANWSGKTGVHGLPLAVLTSVWLLGRLSFLIPDINPNARAVLDLMFLPFSIVLLLPYLSTAKKKINMVFAILLLLLWICNLVFHLDSSGFLGEYWYSRKALLLAVQVIILILTVIFGRVIPFFSRRAIDGYSTEINPWVDRATILSTFFFIGSYLFSELGLLTFWTGIIAGLFHLFRLFKWYSRRVWRVPILFILYLGYFWLIVAFFASSLAAIGSLPLSLATHVFSVGAISVTILGMVTRVTLGHSGRPISASKITLVSYTLVFAGSVTRFLMPLLVPGVYLHAITVSGLLWIGAMLLFLCEYGPILVSPRIDGKPG